MRTSRTPFAALLTLIGLGLTVACGPADTLQTPDKKSVEDPAEEPGSERPELEGELLELTLTDAVFTVFTEEMMGTTLEYLMVTLGDSALTCDDALAYTQSPSGAAGLPGDTRVTVMVGRAYVEDGVIYGNPVAPGEYLGSDSCEGACEWRAASDAWTFDGDGSVGPLSRAFEGWVDLTSLDAVEGGVAVGEFEVLYDGHDGPFDGGILAGSFDARYCAPPEAQD